MGLTLRELTAGVGGMSENRHVDGGSTVFWVCRGGVPKTDQDVVREGVSGKAVQSGAPAERWETQRSWPGEEARKWTFRPKEQHTQRRVKREGL